MTNLNETEKMKRELYFATLSFERNIKRGSAGDEIPDPAAHQARHKRLVSVWDRCEELGVSEAECVRIYVKAVDHSQKLKAAVK